MALALAILLPGAALFIFPAIWMLLASFETVGQIMRFPPTLLPTPWAWDGYVGGFQAMPFGRYFLNTLEIAALASVGSAFTSSLAGFGFARFRVPGREPLFLLVLSTLMLPYAVVMIPQYLLFKSLGWINTYLPLIAPPWFGGPFAIFLFRQSFRGISEELFEAASLDGCGYPRLYAQIALPMAVPALAAALILHFHYAWGDFLAPLIYIDSDEKLTLSLALAAFRGACDCTQWNQFMAVSLVVSSVPFVLFFLGQRYLLRGVAVVVK
jgi:ABC-type glycerol-3-phosphate transport system permease component